MSTLSLVDKARKATGTRAIKMLLANAEKLHNQALIIRWPALEESFGRDLEQIREILIEHQLQLQRKRGAA